MSGPRKRPRLREIRTRVACQLSALLCLNVTADRREGFSPLPAVGLPVGDLIIQTSLFMHTIYLVIVVVIFWSLPVACLQIPCDCETKYTL